MSTSTFPAPPNRLIRLLSYPLIFGLCTVTQFVIASKNVPHLPWAILTAAFGIGAVAVLETIQPFQRQWLVDHDDMQVDVLHACFSLALIFFSTELVAMLQRLLPVSTLWPQQAPMWIQIIMAGLLIDFGLWFMHWLSHRNRFLWRLHALHHSATRLYWLNGERRHPLSAIALASPGIVVAVLLGASATAIGSWFAIVAVHLAFQHANLDYRVGPFRKLLAVAENHRWHHKREYEDAQVNFGEFWMIWDVLFGTSHFPDDELQANDVGIRETMPGNYIGQLCWPFRAEPSDS